MSDNKNIDITSKYSEILNNTKKDNVRKLVCIGGGEIPRIKNGIELPYETKEIDEEIVKLSNKKNPKLLFIGTASSHSEEYFTVIKRIFENLGCIVSNLNLLVDNINIKKVKEDILDTDIIYVGGGNTKFMLEKWKQYGIDKILLQAYQKGIVCSGLSAGSYCWFKYNYDLIEGIGLINAINCVHYDQKGSEAKEKFYKVIKEKQLEGIALDNCVALEIVDEQTKIIKSDKSRNAYKITYKNGKFIEKIL